MYGGRDLAAYQKARRDRFRALGICFRCEKRKVKKGKRQCQKCCTENYQRFKKYLYRRLKDPKFKEAWNAKRRAYQRALKIECFQAYGGPICACCGEKELFFLVIDHIHNNGAAHRREISGKNVGQGQSLYKWLKDHGFPPGHQVLCHNCNWGKYACGGICPHKKRGNKARKNR